MDPHTTTELYLTPEEKNLLLKVLAEALEKTSASVPLDLDQLAGLAGLLSKVIEA
jgi:hypothetical protein